MKRTVCGYSSAAKLCAKQKEAWSHGIQLISAVHFYNRALLMMNFNHRLLHYLRILRNLPAREILTAVIGN